MLQTILNVYFNILKYLEMFANIFNVFKCLQMLHVISTVHFNILEYLEMFANVMDNIECLYPISSNVTGNISRNMQIHQDEK